MKSTLLLVALLAAGALSAAAQGNPFNFPNFSATMVMQAPQGQTALRIFRAGDLLRMNLPGKGYMLTNIKTHDAWMVFTGMCMKIPQPAQNQPNLLALNADARVQITPAGSGAIDGHPTTIENVTITDATGKVTHTRVWAATDLHGFPLKAVLQTDHGPVTLQYRNVQLSPPPASLLQHPGDCRSLSSRPMFKVP